MTYDRTFNGTLHSKDRHYLDGLWRNLGVEPLDERASIIEAHLVRMVLADQFARVQELRRTLEGQPA